LKKEIRQNKANIVKQNVLRQHFLQHQDDNIWGLHIYRYVDPIFMENVMSVKQDILDIIISFISKRKLASLERAFKNDPKIVDGIKKMHASYKAIDDRIEEYCKKNPEICKKAKERRDAF
jgi:hypothetical protein